MEANLALSTAVEQIAEAIIVLDTEGIVRYVNPAFERLTGHTRAQVLGQFPHILAHGTRDPAVCREIWHALTQGNRWQGRLAGRKKNGMHYEAEIDISPVHDATGQAAGFVIVQRDITRERVLETQLGQSQKMEAIGWLAGGVAHDFNNILTVILSCADILLDACDSDDAREWPSGSEIRADLNTIREVANQAAELTRRLLTFSRKQVWQPQVLDLNAAITDTERILRRLIGEDVSLRSELAPTLGHVRADPVQIEQVIVNLAVNARDAIRLRSVDIEGQIVVETANVVLEHFGVKPGAYVMMAVSDNGIGMGEEVKSHLFEPFFTTKERDKGTGLGLATVYGIITHSGGYVDFDSEPGKGTTFRVYLPRVAEDSSAVHEQDTKNLPKGTETILLVEDEDAVRNLARRVLEQCGYTVLGACHPGAALLYGKAFAGSIHLLVTDVVMPEMGGGKLVERLTSLCPEMKVLYISGYTGDVVAHHGVHNASGTFLQKPFTPAALAQKVREVLDKTIPAAETRS